MLLMFRKSFFPLWDEFNQPSMGAWGDVKNKGIDVVAKRQSGSPSAEGP